MLHRSDCQHAFDGLRPTWILTHVMWRQHLQKPRAGPRAHVAQKVPEYCQTEGLRECTAVSDTQIPEHSLTQGSCREDMRLGQQQQQ